MLKHYSHHTELFCILQLDLLALFEQGDDVFCRLDVFFREFADGLKAKLLLESVGSKYVICKERSEKDDS